MGWLSKILKNPVKILVPPPIVPGDVGGKVVDKITDGKKPEVAVKEAAVETADDAAKVAGHAADVENRIDAVKKALVAKIGGNAAEAIFNDIERISKPADASTAEAAAFGIGEFIETGDLNALNPFAIELAAEIKRVRDAYWDKASALPPAVVAAMPVEIRSEAASARVIDVSQINGSLNLPSMAINHLGRATALAAIDLIFFKTIPQALTLHDRHLWCHELWHVRQYREWGVEGFSRRYIAEILQNSDPAKNDVEIAADAFACRHFWVENPAYIPMCPLNPAS